VTYDYYGDGRLKSLHGPDPRETDDDADNTKLFKTLYTYDGTSSRIASIMQGTAV